MIKDTKFINQDLKYDLRFCSHTKQFLGNIPNNKYYPTFVRHIFVYIDSHILSLATSFLAHFLINMDRWLLDKWMQRKGAEESLLIIVKTNVIVRDRERKREREREM